MNLLTVIAKGIVSAGDVGVPKVDASESTVSGIVSAVLMVIGAVAVIFIVLGGIKYSMSQGDSGSIQKAKDTILFAVIGLVIAMVAFAIVNFVVGRF